MNNSPLRIHLFRGYGIEMEYMIVDRDTLRVKPVADELLKHELGYFGSDFENGPVTWSNELVLHVIELKSSRPEKDLETLMRSLADNVSRINTILKSWNAMLLPTGMHPFMKPLEETRIWPHENNEVYTLYNEIFNCHGHGWSNLQSTHLNLPFYDDEEFAKLHAATRILLPIIPVLTASSPIVEGVASGFHDNRMKYYKANQAKIPSIAGRIIPEAVFSKRHYLQIVYDRIKADLAPLDTQQILNPIWVNSRGAIARFDRGSIEIRLMDSQECPMAELAITSLIIETLKVLVSGSWTPLAHQMRLKSEMLVKTFNEAIHHSNEVVIDDLDYLSCFGISAPINARALWKHIYQKIGSEGHGRLSFWNDALKVILEEGNLSSRILSLWSADKATHEDLVSLYRKLSQCLDKNELFSTKREASETVSQSGYLL